MIGVMRRYRRLLQIGLLVVIAAFVLTSIFVGSMGGGRAERGDAVASVNGEKIPLERYQRRYQAYLDAYSRVYRDRFSPELAEQLGLPQQAVNDLVQEALVVQRARADYVDRAAARASIGAVTAATGRRVTDWPAAACHRRPFNRHRAASATSSRLRRVRPRATCRGACRHSRTPQC